MEQIEAAAEKLQTWSRLSEPLPSAVSSAPQAIERRPEAPPASTDRCNTLIPISSAWHRYSLYSQAKLSAIARQLNERPRKTLLYQTRAEEFVECVTAIRCHHRAFSRLAHTPLKTGTMTYLL